MVGDRYQEVTDALIGWNETGVPLVGRLGGRWEAVPCGDDTGLFYFVPLVARHTGWSIDRSLNLFLLGMLAISAVIGSGGLWFTARRKWQRLLSLVPVIASSLLGYKMGDVYIVQSSVVVMLLPWTIYALEAKAKYWRSFSIVFVSGIVLGLAQWMRSLSGAPILLFFVIFAFFGPLRRRFKLLLFAILMIGLSAPLIYARFLLHERDNFLAIHQPDFERTLDRHLFWHTAYVGLAYLTNPYVVAWRDSVAVEYVESIDPHAIYGGEQYESILRSGVTDIAKQHPGLIFYTLAAKFGVLMCFLLLCINVGIPAAIANPKPYNTEWAFWLAIALAGMPGMIAKPIPQYILGMLTLGFYYWYYSVCFLIEKYAPGGGRQSDHAE